jgi:hypothetical protein
MKNFYEVYGADAKLAQLVREISWSRNITILEKCKSEQEREFYIRSCRKFGCSRNVLVHQIENQAFQRTMTSQTNFGAALDPAASVHAQLAVKDEYTFAFLDLEDAHSERELERALTELPLPTRPTAAYAYPQDAERADGTSLEPTLASPLTVQQAPAHPRGYAK